MMTNGALLIGGDERQREARFASANAGTGETFAATTSEAEAADVAEACALAHDAAECFAALPPAERATFIDAVADAIVAIGTC